MQITKQTDVSKSAIVNNADVGIVFSYTEQDSTLERALTLIIVDNISYGYYGVGINIIPIPNVALNEIIGVCNSYLSEQGSPIVFPTQKAPGPEPTVTNYDNFTNRPTFNGAQAYLDRL